MKKEILIGFITATVATAFGVFVFIEFFSGFSFNQTLKLIETENLYGKVLALGALANFFVFFVFLKKKQVYRARGVLLQSFIIALLVMLLTLYKNL